MKNNPSTPIPKSLRNKFVLICRTDLPNEHPYKVMRVFGYRVEDMQNGIDPYPIKWWSEELS